MPAAPRAQAFYLPFQAGNRFCLYHEASTQPRGSVLYVHPFAEEANRTRRMAALQARAFAASGWSVLQFDLFGCGDSDGDFADATWSRWLDDVSEAWRWLHEHTGSVPVLWGLRTGCLLAAQATVQAALRPACTLYWQPVIAGKQYLRQFLRIKFAAQLMASSVAEPSGMKLLYDQLANGQAVEVAGYVLSPELARGIEAAQLVSANTNCTVICFEIGSGSSPGPAVRRWMEQSRAAGVRIDVLSVPGPPFWQTLEIAECPALIEATMRHFEATPE